MPLATSAMVEEFTAWTALRKRRGSPLQWRPKPPGMEAQGVADLVESDGVGELGEKQAHPMAPRGEAAGLPVDAMFAGGPGHRVRRDELAALGEHRQLRLGWFLVFHQAHPQWDAPPATLKIHSGYGRAVGTSPRYAINCRGCAKRWMSPISLTVIMAATV